MTPLRLPYRTRSCDIKPSSYLNTAPRHDSGTLAVPESIIMIKYFLRPCHTNLIVRVDRVAYLVYPAFVYDFLLLQFLIFFSP